MRARRQPGPEQMTAGIRRDGCVWPLLPSPSPRGLGHCHKDPGEGRGKESSVGKHRFVYLYVVKLK